MLINVHNYGDIYHMKNQKNDVGKASAQNR